MQPVSARRVAIAKANGIVCPDEAALAARNSGSIPFAAACALLLMESGGGNNVYGHDVGGALSGYPKTVDASNYDVFFWLVKQKGMPSNGVGPCQITYFGYHEQMIAAGKKPWNIVDNMELGFSILHKNYVTRLTKFNQSTQDSWEEAATLYNVGNLSRGVNDYGRLFYQRYKALRLKMN